MLPQEIIRRKRDRQTLTADEIQSFVRGIVDKSVGEGQIAAFCMAVLLNGMEKPERVALTLAMAQSGRTLTWDDQLLGGPVLDKHSTGGVGDKVSLMLAPLVAACGGFVPMISGRGLGHTGGTLDKMDSIPGYQSQPPSEMIQRAVREAGCAIVGATLDIAPADRVMYAVRDVTGTVESLNLITASILSKKLAAGLQGLVMDVKFGSGAFMADYDDAVALARSIVEVANGAGLPCTALMTDMNQCLGRTAGNAIEVREAIEYLRGENIDPRLHEVTMALAADLLLTGGLAHSAEEARQKLDHAHRKGQAAQIFEKMVALLGGPDDIVTAYEKHLPLAPIARAIYPSQAGLVARIDVRQLGLAIIELGGGRRLTTDMIDHGVGFASVAALGERVGPGEKSLLVAYARSDAQLDRIESLVRMAFTVTEGAFVEAGPVVRERITSPA